MSANSFLLLRYIYLGISLETPVFWLFPYVIFGEKLVSGGIAVMMPWGTFKKWLRRVKSILDTRVL